MDETTASTSDIAARFIDPILGETIPGIEQAGLADDWAELATLIRGAGIPIRDDLAGENHGVVIDDAVAYRYETVIVERGGRDWIACKKTDMLTGEVTIEHLDPVDD